MKQVHYWQLLLAEPIWMQNPKPLWECLVSICLIESICILHKISSAYKHTLIAASTFLSFDVSCLGFWHPILCFAIATFSNALWHAAEDVALLWLWYRPLYLNARMKCDLQNVWFNCSRGMRYLWSKYSHLNRFFNSRNKVFRLAVENATLRCENMGFAGLRLERRETI